MRWATFRVAGADQDRVGLVEAGRVYALEPGLALIDLLGDDGERLARAGERARSDPADVLDLDAVRLRAPIPRPPSVRDFFAFEQHVRTARQRRGLEMDPDWYELPVFYFANPAATLGLATTCQCPRRRADGLRAGMAAVVGRGGATSRRRRPSAASLAIW